MAETFGDVLKSLRTAHGLSLAALAARAYCSNAEISYIENGKRRAAHGFAASCDRVFGTTPLLVLLLEIDDEGDTMKRRALVAGFAAGIGAGTGVAVFAEQVRHGLLDLIDTDPDWDQVVADYTRRLAVDSSATYGTSLLGHLTVARQHARELGRTPDRLRAMAGLSLLYGLWSGDRGDIAGARGWYRTSIEVADRSQDVPTLAYTLGRSAARNVYEGATIAETTRDATRALGLSPRANRGALEAYSALAHVHALTGDLNAGRNALMGMRTVAAGLPDADAVAGPLQRTASVRTFFECRVAPWPDAQRAFAESEPLLRPVTVWYVEARIYLARAMVAAGDVAGGIGYALDAIRSTTQDARIIGLAVSDLCSVVPAGWRSDELDELRTYAATGPKPWEMLTS